MPTKTKLISNPILVNVMSIVILILISRFTHFNGDNALNPIGGMLLGGICIIVFQQYMQFDWVYQLRYILNGVAIGFVLLLTSLSYLITGSKTINIDKILLMGLVGLGLGLLAGLIDYLINVIRERAIPYTGHEKPTLMSKAYIWNLDQVNRRGRALLMSDRLLFMEKGSQYHEVLFSDIQYLEVKSSILYPFKLVFHLKEAGFVSINLSMPYIWKKKITDAMNRNPDSLG